MPRKPGPRPDWPEPSYYKPALCGHEIGRSPAYIYALLSSGALRAVRVGGVLRVPAEAWRAWLAENVAPFDPASESVESADDE